MKDLKIILGIIGALCIIPATLLALGVFSTILTSLLSVAFFRIVILIIQVTIMCIIVIVILFSTYIMVVDLLERHFDYFKEKEKQ